ncbi:MULTISPECIES: bifunctional diguanylate cyclase/phosphodiesterase [Nostoc]|uniref:PAS domain-containing protein n=2 Tax=Nostoc TaxID=1177 RepID=A0ABR8I3A3_9NOSO|nr:MULTISPECIES: PAS domain-containing protein [Nostoc]MBD2561264.1 PAS domain-containing protein [Nostoc linckia FACHB-391]MBD2646027.1 PAS domain-containing protein [Nostoc foliaceum FACHB-393]
MLEFGKRLLAYKQFIPHGHCYLWKTELVGLHIVSDSLIALAYYSIPITLLYFVRKRQDLPFNWIFLLFATFIVTCGTTHLMEIWTLWYPTYWLSGCLKAITAVVSLYTACELIPLIPKALALPSHAQLEAANRELEREISERQAALCDRKQAELALQEREAMLRRIGDNLPNGAIYKVIRQLDGSDRFDYISAGIERLTEVRAEDALKDPSLLYRQFIPEDALLFQAAVDESRQNLSVLDIQVRIQMPSAHLKWFHFRSTPRQLQDGCVVWDGLVVDVTNLKCAEETLRKSEALLEESQRVARLGNWEFDIASQKVSWSKQLFDLFNRDPALLEPNYQENLQLYWAEDAGKLAQATERAISTGESYKLILRASPTYGSTIYIEGIGHAEFNADGKVIRLYGTAQDVTERLAALNERKQAEKELRRSETLLATAQKIAHLGSWEWYLESQKQIWSDETFRILGLNSTQSAPTQAAFLQMLHPEDRPVLQRRLLKAIANKTPFNLEYRIIRPDGSLRYLESRAEVAYDTQGKTVRLYGAIQDITERKESELEITKSRDLLEAVFNESADALFLVDTETLLTIDCNNRAVELFAASSKAELIGIEGHTLQKEQFTSDELTSIVEKINQQELWSREIAYFTKQGNCFWGNIAIKQIRVADRVMNLVRVTDISPKKRIEEERQRAEVALAKSEEQLRLTMEFNYIGSWDWNLLDGAVIWNDNHFRLLGLEPETSSARYQVWRNAIHPKDVERVEQALFNAMTQHTNYEAEYRVIHPDGKVRWLVGKGRSIYNEVGKPVRMLGVVIDISDRKQAEIALKQSEIRYRAIVEDQTELIARYLPDGTLTFVNQAYAVYFGQSPEEMIGSRYQPIIFEEDRERVVQLVASISVDNPVVIIENRVVVANKVRWTQWHNRMLFDEQGCFIEFQSVGRDITALKQIEETLFQEKELAQVTLQSIGDAVITTDAFSRIQYLNPIAESLLGCSEASAQGLPLKEILRIVHETTREVVQNPIEQALKENRIVSLANHTVLITENDQEIAIQDSAAPIRNREGQVIGAVMVFHDVTQNRQLSRQLSWQATHDALTGLVNRQEFERRVEQALHLASLDYQVYGLCYLDLDHFKIVNDTCGHVAGDELLRQITASLQEKIRKTDTLARLGGDEFGVLLNQCTQEEALGVANNLLSCVQEFRFVWQEQVFSIGVSIGLVGIDTNTKSLAEIISTADAACYAAKNRGRNRVYIAQTDDQERLQQRGEMQWASRISQALESDWFCLYAQRITAIAPTDQNGDHYEVLLRLRDEQGNLVLPMAFIPAAERYNLMHLIDRWVIQTLFRNWTRVVGDKQSIYAINLSGSSINDDQFIDFLYEQFTLHPISPQCICFEITETVAIANLIKAKQFIESLQQMGCRFALDDFGVGMSSFAYLKSLPVDYLKIDGSFIRNIVENPLDNAIVTAITSISCVMGIQTIAEFVENDAILERITALGIDYAQGYGIAVPCPLYI